MVLGGNHDIHLANKELFAVLVCRGTFTFVVRVEEEIDIANHAIIGVLFSRRHGLKVHGCHGVDWLADDKGEFIGRLAP